MGWARGSKIQLSKETVLSRIYSCWALWKLMMLNHRHSSSPLDLFPRAWRNGDHEMNNRKCLNSRNPRVNQSKWRQHQLKVQFQCDSSQSSDTPIHWVEMPQIQDDGQRPPYAYTTLIAMAILRAPNCRLTLDRIYDWVKNTFRFHQKGQQQKRGQVAVQERWAVTLYTLWRLQSPCSCQVVNSRNHYFVFWLSFYMLLPVVKCLL